MNAHRQCAATSHTCPHLMDILRLDVEEMIFLAKGRPSLQSSQQLKTVGQALKRSTKYVRKRKYRRGKTGSPRKDDPCCTVAVKHFMFAAIAPAVQHRACLSTRAFVITPPTDKPRRNVRPTTRMVVIIDHPLPTELCMMTHLHDPVVSHEAFLQCRVGCPRDMSVCHL